MEAAAPYVDLSPWLPMYKEIAAFPTLKSKDVAKAAGQAWSHPTSVSGKYLNRSAKERAEHSQRDGKIDR